MTFEEAKAREDYEFIINGIDEFIHDLKTGEFINWSEYDEEDGYFNYGVAVLEIGFVDIELNVNAISNEDGTGYVNQPYPCYFICVKGYNGEWCHGGYLDDIGYDVNVDWYSPDWMKQLEVDMFNTLMKVVERLGLKIDEPNWTEPNHEFDVFDRLCAIAKERR